jgi:hypothetical protein
MSRDFLFQLLLEQKDNLVYKALALVARMEAVPHLKNDKILNALSASRVYPTA